MDSATSAEYLYKLRRNLPFIVPLIVLIIGGFFLAMTPPGHVPDAWAHIYRISSITNGDVLAHPVDSQSLLHQSTENVGGQVDKKWIDYSLQHYNGYDTAVVIPETLENTSDKTVEAPFNNTANNSPIAYLPQIITFSLSKLFSISTNATYYLSEVFMLVVYAITMGLSIASIKNYRILTSLILTNPLMLFRYSFAISADSMTLMSACLFTCLIFGALETHPSNRYCYGLALTSFILVLTKFIYAPLALLSVIILIIHRKKPAPKKGSIVLIAVIAFSYLIQLIWMRMNNWFVTTPMIVSYDEMLSKKKYLLSGPSAFADFIQQLLKAIITGQSNLTSRSQTFIILTFWIGIVILLILLIVCTFLHALPKGTLYFWWGSFLLTIFIILLIYSALWLQYTPRGVSGVDGMQFRYFMPLIPLWGLTAFSLVSNLFETHMARSKTSLKPWVPAQRA